ncbi:MAG: hypothetical protein PGN29_11740 [Gordonia paraffinivorans]
MTVPSAVWRVLMVVGAVPGTSDLRTYELAGDATAGYVYVFGLSGIQLGAAFLTVGLTRPWGARWGRYVVPLWPVVVIAAMGAVTVTWLFTIDLPLALAAGHRPDAGRVHDGALVVMVACYAPIVAWGPLTLVAIGEYAARRSCRRWPGRAATLAT